MAAAMFLAWNPAHAQTTAAQQDQVIKNVRLDQKIDAQVPLNIAFHDEDGRRRQLHEFVGRRPVLLVMIQYRCTMLCSEEMRTLLDSLKELKFDAGREFDVMIVSIDSREKPDFAAEFKKGWVDQYGRPGAAAGWHFLTGDKAAIDRLADSIGYHYQYDPLTDQFAHPDGVIVLTPLGKIARYFFRLNYPARDLRLGIVEAAAGKVGTPLDGLALWCYHYDPVTGEYGLAVIKLVRLAALVTVFALGAALVLMNRRGRRGPFDREGTRGEAY